MSKLYGAGMTDQAANTLRDRWVTLFVVLLLAATTAFVVGAAVEPSHAHGEAARTSETSMTAGGESGSRVEAGGESGSHVEPGDEGEQSTESGNASAAEPGSKEGGSDESIFGVDTESAGAVTAAVLVSLLVAAIVWWSPMTWALVAGAAFCVGAAVLDIREIGAQLDEGSTGVATVAVVLVVLHLAAAACAVTAVARRRRPGPTKALTVRGT